MVGTIGRFRIKPGHEEQVKALTQEWERSIRPTIPVVVVTLLRRPVAGGGETADVIAMQDEAAYQALANRAEQDAWYRRWVEHLEGELTWEDVV